MQTRQFLADETLTAPLLTSLAGREVLVLQASTAFDPGEAVPAVAAMYALDSGNLAAMIAMDIGLASSLACAMVLIPPVIAEESKKTGRLDASLRDNLKEILGIANRLLRTGYSARLRMAEIDYGPVLGGTYRFQSTAIVARQDFQVGVPGYPGGRLALLALR
ncbi:MAG: hypothetical protein ABI743_10795 [bacterium]